MEEEKKFIIYLHRCPNGKCYVGMTSQMVNQRWGKNGYKYKNNKDFYPDIEIYGWDNIEHIILEEGLSREDACESEKYNIKKYNCIYPNGYNLSIGGDIGALGCVRSEETKQKMKQSFTEERRKIISNSAKRRKGITQKFSKEHLDNIRNANKNRIWTNEQKEKISERVSISIVQFALSGELLNIFKNSQEASTYVLGTSTNITRCCKGKSLTYKGYVWRYLNDEFNKYNYNRKTTTTKGIRIVCDKYVFNSCAQLSKYYNESESRNMIYRYLNGSKTMPQKWLDRGLRYYNPETDKDLPIYVDTKNEV